MGVLGRLLRFLGLAREPTSTGGFTLVEGPDGQKMLVDEATLEYLQSDAQEPSQASLDGVLDRARRVRVFDDGVIRDQLLGKKCLIDTCAAEDLQAVRAALRIEDGPAGHCMCHGSQALELLDADDQALAVVGVHHGVSIRWGAWRDDAKLVHPGGLFEWMAGHGVHEPLREYEAEATERQEQVEALERWKAAAPDALAPWVDPVEADGQVEYAVPPSNPAEVPDEVAAQLEARVRDPALDAVADALAGAFPDPAEQARALFAWHGNGTGPWTGYPSYEGVVDLLLCRMPTSVLAPALTAAVAPEILEGAARHFSSLVFVRKRAGMDPTPVPGEVRKRLLRHVTDTGDADQLKQARGTLS